MNLVKEQKLFLRLQNRQQDAPMLSPTQNPAIGTTFEDPNSEFLRICEVGGAQVDRQNLLKAAVA